MNWTHVMEFAELISAVAAMVTVGLAFVELLSRSRAKKAEVAMDIYSDFLYIKQELTYAMTTVHTFADNFSSATSAELITYAKTHTVNPQVFDMIQKITKNSISSFDCLSSEGKENSVVILELSGNLTNFLKHTNTFLEAFAGGASQDPARTMRHCKKIMQMYDALLPGMECASDILRNKLKKTHSRSNWYLILLLTVLVIFLLLCFLL